jgi:hypothetical protein
MRAALVLTLVAAIACDRDGATTTTTAPPPAPPSPDVRETGTGCHEVTLTSPCSLLSVTSSPSSDDPSDVGVVVLYRDAAGHEVQPYYLHARPGDTEVIESFLRAHATFDCGGGWTSAPCNDAPRGLTGFPTPPAGKVEWR